MNFNSEGVRRLFDSRSSGEGVIELASRRALAWRKMSHQNPLREVGAWMTRFGAT
ncbi:hypothetical protein [Pseudomonas aeruginosa]|uniref:hypothetical protein n=1 Tax=Pseudomonas aeruginosa TaxID=287 RepID=UPI002B406F89|nr:hypothetical protein [Pseudomonas aeruginosa]